MELLDKSFTFTVLSHRQGKDVEFRLVFDDKEWKVDHKVGFLWFHLKEEHIQFSWDLEEVLWDLWRALKHRKVTDSEAQAAINSLFEYIDSLNKVPFPQGVWEKILGIDYDADAQKTLEKDTEGIKKEDE
jgi:hypothetical protein